MGIIGFRNQEKLAVYQLVSAVLHLGNVRLEKADVHHGGEGVIVSNRQGMPI